jgi:peptidyl-prolyl cis-trans isomerase SurA
MSTVLTLIGVGLSLAGAPERRLVDRVVAIVNDEVITLSELETVAAPLLDADTTAERRRGVLTSSLDNMIAEKLLEQQIRENQVSVSPEDVERAIEDICRQNGLTREQLEEAITSRGMSMARYRSDLEKQLVRLKIVDLKVRSRVVVSESDVRAEWERQVGLEKREKMVKLRHFFFRWGEDASPADKKRVISRALEARGRALAGEDFAEIAKQVSEGPTATDGGDLGWISGGNLLPELARAVAKMQKGELSAPIDTDNGVHVVLLEDTKIKEPTGYDAAKNQIHARLYQEEIERQMRLWLEEVRKEGSVVVKLGS